MTVHTAHLTCLLSLWCCVVQITASLNLVSVMASGGGKTTACEAVITALRNNEAFLRSRVNNDSTTRQDTRLAMPSSSGRRPPSQTPFVISNYTFPGVQSALCDYHGAVFLSSDEFFAGFGSSLMKSAQDQERAKIASLLSGGRYISTAMSTKDGPQVDSCNVSGVSTTQPSTLQEAILTQGELNDGLLHRFQYVLCSAMTKIPPNNVMTEIKQQTVAGISPLTSTEPTTFGTEVIYCYTCHE